MSIACKEVLRIVGDLREQFQREANQSILKKDHGQGLAALGSMDALERFERRLAMSYPDYEFARRGGELESAHRQRVSPIRGKRA